MSSPAPTDEQIQEYNRAISLAKELAEKSFVEAKEQLKKLEEIEKMKSIPA